MLPFNGRVTGREVSSHKEYIESGRTKYMLSAVSMTLEEMISSGNVATP